MNRSTGFVVSLLTGCLLICQCVFGQTSDPNTGTKRISILNDKYSFQFPAAAKLSPRVADIMAADPNENRETRVILDKGDMRLVIFAQELYAISGKNIFEELSTEVEPEFDFRRRILYNTDSVMAVLSTPAKFDSSSGATLINSLLVKSPDNTVTRVDAFINPPAFSSRGEYMALTDSIFSTIQKGNRRIQLTPKEETYRIFGTESSFNFKLPAGYFVTVDEKYDFGVFKIKKFKNSLTDTVYAAITIYAGHHPSYIHKEYGYTEEKAGKTKGNFLQLPVEWIHVNDKTQSFFLKEKFIPADMVQKDLVFHVAMLTNKKESLDELTKIIESVKLVK